MLMCLILYTDTKLRIPFEDNKSRRLRHNSSSSFSRTSRLSSSDRSPSSSKGFFHQKTQKRELVEHQVPEEVRSEHNTSNTVPWTTETIMQVSLARIMILHRCLSRFRPLPPNWFKFSLKGNWHFDVALGCLMFSLVNRLSQLNLNLLPLLPSTPVTLSSVEQSILACDPIAMALYAIVVSVCAPLRCMLVHFILGLKGCDFFLVFILILLISIFLLKCMIHVVFMQSIYILILCDYDP
ncbi:hypothetical protein UlMin_007709 [Ulmus minor]